MWKAKAFVNRPLPYTKFIHACRQIAMSAEGLGLSPEQAEAITSYTFR